MSYDNFHQSSLLSLLFFDNLLHPDSSPKNHHEIEFDSPVILFQLRIVKSGFPVHHSLKYLKNVTQTDPIRAFEVFFRDLNAPDSRYTLLAKTDLLNEKPQANDTIIPIEKGVSNHFFPFFYFPSLSSYLLRSSFLSSYTFSSFFLHFSFFFFIFSLPFFLSFPFLSFPSFPNFSFCFPPLPPSSPVFPNFFSFL